jgi:hypothetical protein
MTPGQLVKAVATALDAPEETVTQHDRNLVVAGLRTKGGRGRSAPDVTPLDAARLFSAAVGSLRAKDSVKTVVSYEQAICDFKASQFSEAELRQFASERGFEYKGLEAFADPAILALPEDHNFVDAITALISAAAAPIADLDDHLKRFAELLVRVHTSELQALSIAHRRTRSLRYTRLHLLRDGSSKRAERPELLPHRKYARFYGMIQDRSIYGSSIMLLGKAFRDDGLDFETTSEALDSLLGERKSSKKKKVA